MDLSLSSHISIKLGALLVSNPYLSAGMFDFTAADKLELNVLVDNVRRRLGYVKLGFVLLLPLGLLIS